MTAEPPRLRTHTCVLSRAESGYISLYAEDDLEGDEADVQENGTLESCLSDAACGVV
jgi:hypothetical protein